MFHKLVSYILLSSKFAPHSWLDISLRQNKLIDPYLLALAGLGASELGAPQQQALGRILPTVFSRVVDLEAHCHRTAHIERNSGSGSSGAQSSSSSSPTSAALAVGEGKEDKKEEEGGPRSPLPPHRAIERNSGSGSSGAQSSSSSSPTSAALAVGEGKEDKKEEEGGCGVWGPLLSRLVSQPVHRKRKYAALSVLVPHIAQAAAAQAAAAAAAQTAQTASVGLGPSEWPSLAPGLAAVSALVQLTEALVKTTILSAVGGG
eukprot:CAMPEP_0171982912 /NCGR_PEP_ID=MMETSP0993-20121228/273001_1 /TAXON_ID=483369 /ORGANISM="non described non described, Strain CCMP2098" /LENGTH=260 /DNA_ID=CAMNT_0012635605 /DNA_START=381 /DNA_END=1161 /DNA_ORIENTATION=-